MNGHRVAFRRAELSPELLAWLLEEEVLSAEPSRLLQLGFDACVDYPALSEHHYYEGYYHARGGGCPGDVDYDPGFDASLPAKGSVHPRTGRNFDKPAAPPRLRAFVEAFDGSMRAEHPHAGGHGIPTGAEFRQDLRAFLDERLKEAHARDEASRVAEAAAAMGEVSM